MLVLGSSQNKHGEHKRGLKYGARAARVREGLEVTTMQDLQESKLYASFDGLTYGLGYLNLLSVGTIIKELR